MPPGVVTPQEEADVVSVGFAAGLPSLPVPINRRPVLEPRALLNLVLGLQV